jgi:hypothetical protein
MCPIRTLTIINRGLAPVLTNRRGFWSSEAEMVYSQQLKPTEMKNFLLPLTGIVLFAALGLSSCHRKAIPQAAEPAYQPALPTEAGPPVIVYKTRENYDNKVPVILSADKKEIISYPAPGDVYYKGELALPYELGKGYLLDRRGINENVAFLEMTYEDYANLPAPMTPTELYTLIKDNDPLLEMWHCGNAYSYKNLEKDLILKVESGKFESCRRLK